MTKKDQVRTFVGGLLILIVAILWVAFPLIDPARGVIGDPLIDGR